MSELTKEVINVLAKEEDDKILKEVLDYYEFLKWRNQRELERCHFVTFPASSKSPWTPFPP